MIIILSSGKIGVVFYDNLHIKNIIKATLSPPAILDLYSKGSMLNGNPDIIVGWFWTES